MIRFYSSLISCMLIMLAITMSTNPAAAYSPPKPWSTWYQIKDDALDGIWFSWKCSEDRCDWRWDNRYSTEVKISFKLRHIDSGGAQKIASGEQRLATGSNESPAYTMTARELKGVDIEILEPKYTGPRSTKYVPSSTAEVDAENIRKEAERLAANKRKEAERQAIAQRALEEQQEQYRREQLAEERGREEAHEERRQAQREEAANRRQQAQDKQDFNNALATGLQSMQNSLNQGAQTYNNAVQANRDVDAQLRRQKADREREAREQQRQRNEEAANQQRQAEEKRRLQQQQQVALERSQREEQERQQRQRDEQQRVAQQEAEKKRQQQKKQLSCTNMTLNVSGTTKRLKGAGHCDGELAAYLTNNSGIKVTCVQKFERNGVLSGSGAQVHMRPGETVGGESGGLWECGHADTDSYKFYCIAADDPYECMQKF